MLTNIFHRSKESFAKICLFALATILGISSVISAIPSYALSSDNNQSDSSKQVDSNRSSQAGFREFSNRDYYFKKYNVDVKVGEDNTYNVTEEIDAHFNVAKHGLIRKIQTDNSVQRLDGSSSRVKARIDNLEVYGGNYTRSNSGQYLTIKIGDSDKTITGDKSYTISYNYKMGKDKLKDADELYFNLLGDQWDAPTANFTFSITMPKSFDAQSLGFSAGSFGSTDSGRIKYNVNGNVIKGQVTGTLLAYKAVTVRLTLPDGYFVYNSGLIDYLYNYWWIVVLIICLASILISLKLWWSNGRDDLVTTVIQYAPPKGMNSLDVSTIYEGRPTDNGVVSLLIYLANLGYLKISTDDKGKNYTITKIKSYDGNNQIEAKFMAGLFASGERVTDSDLKDKFYKTVQDIIKEEKGGSLARSLFVNNNKYSKLIVRLIVLCLSLVVFPLTLSTNNLAFGGVFLLISAIFAFGVDYSDADMVSSVTASVVASIVILSGIASIIGDSPFDENGMWIASVLAVLSTITMSVFLVLVRKRSPEGGRLLGEARGLKDFLKTVEKDRIESMVNDNPNFFYDILPFAYVLGVSSAWISKFEDLAIEPPDWYDSTNSTFNMLVMSNLMTNTMSSVSSSMTYDSSSSSSGGGFSGGGSGGGGGSSW